MRLLSPADVRELAGRLGVRPSKRLGQNFVVEPGQSGRSPRWRPWARMTWCSRWARASARSRWRCSRPARPRLVAVEIDRVMAGELPRTAAARAPELANRLAVINADALRVGERDLPAAPSMLVANLPYNVAVPVMLHLLAALPSLTRGLVMVQAEVADRMCAAPGSRVYGAPSVKLAWYATARPAGTVPRSVFWPVPNVDSRLVAFTRRDPPVTSAPREQVFALIDAAFGQRRKTLRAALAGWAGSAPEAERLLRAAGIDPGARGESLSVAEFARLAAARTI